MVPTIHPVVFPLYHYMALTFPRIRSCCPWLLYLPLRLCLSILQLKGQSLGALRRHRGGGVSGLQPNCIHQTHVSVCPPCGSASSRKRKAAEVRQDLGQCSSQSSTGWPRDCRLRREALCSHSYLAMTDDSSVSILLHISPYSATMKLGCRTI